MNEKNISTELTQMLNIKIPVLCAPMFLVSNEDMLVAAFKSGGLGLIPALNFRTLEAFEKSLKKLSDLKIQFGVNLIVQKSNKLLMDQLDLCIKYKIKLIVTSLGNPSIVLSKAKDHGVKVFSDVVNIKHALKVAKQGVDALVAVGAGAGGHGGDKSLQALIPSLINETKLPVIAAGGLSDGKNLASVLSLGACGAYMGTRFIASAEAPVDEKYKQAILNSNLDQIVNTHKVDGFPGNFIKTPELLNIGLEDSFLETILNQNKSLKKYLALFRVKKSLFNKGAATENTTETAKKSKSKKVSYKTVFSAGHGVSMVSEIMSINEIYSKILDEYFEVKLNLP